MDPKRAMVTHALRLTRQLGALGPEHGIRLCETGLMDEEIHRVATAASFVS